MSDAADLAEKEIEQRLEQARNYRKEEHSRPFTGLCSNCDEPVEEPKRFCDADCRDDYVARMASRNRGIRQ